MLKSWVTILTAMITVQVHATMGDWVRRSVCLASLVGAAYTYSNPVVTIPDKKDLDPAMVRARFNNLEAAHQELTAFAQGPHQNPYGSVFLAPFISTAGAREYRVRGAKPIDAVVMSHEKNLYLNLSYAALLFLCMEMRRLFYYVPFSDFLKHSEKELTENPGKIVIIDALMPESSQQEEVLKILAHRYNNHPDTEIVKGSSWDEIVTIIQNQLLKNSAVKDTRFELLITGAPGFFVFPSNLVIKQNEFENLGSPALTELNKKIGIRVSTISSSPKHNFIGNFGPTEPMIEALLKIIDRNNTILITPHKPLFSSPTTFSHLLDHSLKKTPGTRLLYHAIHYLSGFGLFMELFWGNILGLGSNEWRLHFQEYEVHTNDL